MTSGWQEKARMDAEEKERTRREAEEKAQREEKVGAEICMRARFQ